MADTEMQGYEDVTLYQLSDAREKELLEKQIECNFIWTNKAGHGLGVIMNYVARNGSIWVTATSQRARVKALRRDPRGAGDRVRRIRVAVEELDRVVGSVHEGVVDFASCRDRAHRPGATGATAAAEAEAEAAAEVAVDPLGPATWD